MFSFSALGRCKMKMLIEFFVPLGASCHEVTPRTREQRPRARKTEQKRQITAQKVTREVTLDSGPSGTKAPSTPVSLTPSPSLPFCTHHQFTTRRFSHQVDSFTLTRVTPAPRAPTHPRRPREGGAWDPRQPQLVVNGSGGDDLG